MGYLEQFNYQISGNAKGHKLVFLHGLMGTGSNWGRIVPAFEADYQVLRYDQRGHGRSTKPDSGYHPRDFAADLKIILDELGWDRVYLVGHSMGGRNALEFAAQNPERIIKLVLEDIGPNSNYVAVERMERLLDLVPLPFVDREEMRRFFAEDYPALISWYPNAPTIAKFLQTNIEILPDGSQAWRFAREAIFKTLREARLEDRWPMWQNLKPPTLVIRGELSNDLDPETFRRMGVLRPQTKLVQIEGAGHWVHFEQTQAFIRVVQAFFGE